MIISAGPRRFSSAAAVQQPSQPAAWTQVTIPAALATSTGARMLLAASDGYLYVGGNTGSGIYRALVSDLLANPNGATWQDLTATWPSHAGSLMAVSCLSEGPNGEIFAGAGIDTSGTASTWCVVAKWTGSAWSVSNTFGPRYQTTGVDFDSAGNIWAMGKQDGIFKSTNGGATFTLVHANPYAAFGQATGYVFSMRIFGDRIYWGGEGAVNSTNLAFDSNTVECAATGTYSGNHQDISSDGTQTVAPTEMIASGRVISGTGQHAQRKFGGTWSDVVSASSANWIAGATVKGPAAHEFYIGGTRAGGGGGVIKTTNGTTWALFNDGLSSAAMDTTGRMAISSLGTLFLQARDASSNRTLWIR